MRRLSVQSVEKEYTPENFERRMPEMYIIYAEWQEWLTAFTWQGL
ncbi:hypothetical protein Defa_08370 [Desulfovibrio sp. TH_2024_36128]|uniref:Uncharacterized protein n=1 Tax=Desulfovibrio falkowii TaxID=3136602 RepID=A0ABQ0E6L3_9BACT